MATIEELKNKITVLESMDDPGMQPQIDAAKAELAALEAQLQTPVTAGGAAPAGVFTLPVSEDEYEKAGSKFAQPGMHLSEFGMPTWKQAGVSLTFPFTIVDGNDKGLEGEIYCGVNKDGIWKLKETLKALGVAVTITNGRPTFDPMQVVGKKGMTLWTMQKDSRSVEEGGKGTTYSKAVSVFPEGTPPPADLGI